MVETRRHTLKHSHIDSGLPTGKARLATLVLREYMFFTLRDVLQHNILGVNILGRLPKGLS